MTTPDLTELDRLHAEANPPKWFDASHYETQPDRHELGCGYAGIVTFRERTDKDFILALRNAYPSLAARIRALEAKVGVADRLAAEAQRSIDAWVTGKSWKKWGEENGEFVKALAEYRTPPAKESSDE